MINYFHKFFFFAPLIIPTLLISGPFLPDLFLVLTCLYYLVNKDFLRFTYEKIKNNIDFFIYFFLISILIFSSISSDYILDSLKSSVFHFRFILFGIIYFYLIKKNDLFLEFQIKILLITLLVLTLDAFFQLIYGKNILGYELHASFTLRPTSFFLDDLKIGNYLAKFSLFLFALCVFKNKFIKTCLVTLLLSWTIIFFSGERSSFILFSLGVISIAIIYLNFFSNENIKKIIILTIPLCIILIIITSYLEPKYYYKMIINPLYELAILGDGEFLPAHRNHYLASYEIFKNNIFFGSGPNTFRYECQDIALTTKINGCSTHPHNFYFQILSEGGIFTLFIVSFFYIKLIYTVLKSILRIFKNKNRRDMSLVIVGAMFLIAFFPLSPNGNLFNNWLNINILFSLGFYFYLNERIKSD